MFVFVYVLQLILTYWSLARGIINLMKRLPVLKSLYYQRQQQYQGCLPLAQLIPFCPTRVLELGHMLKLLINQVLFFSFFFFLKLLNKVINNIIKVIN